MQSTNPTILLSYLIYLTPMKPSTTSFAILLAVLVFSCKTVETTETPVKQYTIAQFMDIVQINGGSFSADDSKIVFNSKETGIFNAYEINIQSGEKKQLTNSTTDAIFAEALFPNDDRLIYSSDKGGNEITHLFVRNTDGSVKD